VANTAATRIRDFTQVNPPSFIGSKSKENPQKFLDMAQKVTDIMVVNSSESAELDTY